MPILDLIFQTILQMKIIFFYSMKPSRNIKRKTLLFKPLIQIITPFVTHVNLIFKDSMIKKISSDKNANILHFLNYVLFYTKTKLKAGCIPKWINSIKNSSIFQKNIKSKIWKFIPLLLSSTKCLGNSDTISF